MRLRSWYIPLVKVSTPISPLILLTLAQGILVMEVVLLVCVLRTPHRAEALPFNWWMDLCTLVLAIGVDACTRGITLILHALPRRAGRSLTDLPETVKRGFYRFPPPIPSTSYYTGPTRNIKLRFSQLKAPPRIAWIMYFVFLTTVIHTQPRAHVAEGVAYGSGVRLSILSSTIIGLQLSFQRGIMRKHDYTVERARFACRRDMRSRPIHCLFESKFIISRRLVIVKTCSEPNTFRQVGGGAGGSKPKNRWYGVELNNYSTEVCLTRDRMFKYIGHDSNVTSPIGIPFEVPMPILTRRLTVPELRKLANEHGGNFNNKVSSKKLQDYLCRTCTNHKSYFTPVTTSTTLELEPCIKSTRERVVSPNPDFPPKPCTEELGKRIIRDFCSSTSPEALNEVGCAVCRGLTLRTEAKPLKTVEEFLVVLDLPGRNLTRRERKTADEPVSEVEGPILDRNCRHVCTSCERYLRKKSVPPSSLANGGWLGDVPDELQGLTFAEKLLICRVYHSSFVVRVGAGQRKMKANVVLFAKPMPKIYKALPPP